jgi:hypothetical protein
MTSAFAKENLTESTFGTTIARLVKGTIGTKDFGPQLELHIDPLDHEIGGETGVYHEWYGVKMTKTSKLGALVTALSAIPGPNGEEGFYVLDTNTGTTDVGASLTGNCVNQIFVWETKKLSELVQLGKNMTDPELRIPVEALTQEEADRRIAAAGGKRQKSANGTVSSSTAASAASAPVQISPEESEMLTGYVLSQIPDDGMGKPQFVKFGASDATLKEYPGFKKDVVSLTFAKQQLEAGNLALDGDKYVLTDRGRALVAA